MATRIWICPALCGCELDISAEAIQDASGTVLWQPWTGAADDDGTGRLVSFRHPTGPCITKIVPRVVCPAHAHFLTDPLIADPTYGGEMAGYLFTVDLAARPGQRLTPRAPTTPAENLYVGLSRYTGQTWRPDTCRCKIYQMSDRTTPASQTVAPHVVHTHKCSPHAADDDAHSQAIAECVAKNDAVKAVTDLHSDLTAEDVEWSFNDQRELTVSAPTKGLVIAVGKITPQ